MNSHLSHPQRAIVEQPHTGTHMLVLAAPGSGKTRVIIERIAHLLATGAAEPEQITVMTFTDKAAATLVERLDARLGGAAQGIQAGTIHSISHRLLDTHGAAIGLRVPFNIYEPRRQEAALRARQRTCVGPSMIASCGPCVMR